MMIGIN